MASTNDQIYHPPGSLLATDLNDLNDSKLQHLPFKFVDYSGPAEVDTFFVIDSSNANDLKSTFRGRELRGTDFKVPKDYVGLIVRPDTKNVTENKKWKTMKKFTKFTYWNREQPTADTDHFPKWLHWLDLSAQIHKPITKQEVDDFVIKPRQKSEEKSELKQEKMEDEDESESSSTTTTTTTTTILKSEKHENGSNGDLKKEKHEDVKMEEKDIKDEEIKKEEGDEEQEEATEEQNSDDDEKKTKKKSPSKTKTIAKLSDSGKKSSSTTSKSPTDSKKRKSSSTTSSSSKKQKK